MIDSEALAVTLLGEDPRIVQAGIRVATETPQDRSAPWVKVTLINPQVKAGHDTDYFATYQLQMDCYCGEGGTSADAFEVVQLVRQCLLDAQNRMTDNEVVGQIRFGACPRVPDPGFTPTRQRYVLTVFLDAHPG